MSSLYNSLTTEELLQLIYNDTENISIYKSLAEKVSDFVEKQTLEVECLEDKLRDLEIENESLNEELDELKFIIDGLQK
jgi:predicted RNase H-like nuclease (RuvC/YqgF family)